MYICMYVCVCIYVCMHVYVLCMYVLCMHMYIYACLQCEYGHRGQKKASDPLELELQ